MRPDDKLLSAYIDGEVPEEFASRVEESINTDPDCRNRYESFVSLRAAMHEHDVPELSERRQSALDGIRRRVSVQPRGALARSWRRINLPLPAAAAAAVVFLVLGALLVWSLVSSEPAAARDQLATGRDVDVTIRVDDADMESVLQWLVDKEMLGEISIQLPEQEFRIMGEPVLLKPDDYPEGLRE